MSVQIEICVDSFASARAAQSGGADRIELCADLPRGGTTPSAGLIELVRKSCTLDLRILIRPRAGDFAYSNEEVAVMEQDVAYAKRVGADGVVLGVLRADGTIDRDVMRSLIKLALPLHVTFHRAFDVASDPFESLEILKELGVEILLTSGQRSTAPEGQDLICDLVKHSDGCLRVMAGSGLAPHNVASLIQFTGVQDVHVGTGVTTMRTASVGSMFAEPLSLVDADLVQVFRQAASR